MTEQRPTQRLLLLAAAAAWAVVVLIALPGSARPTHLAAGWLTTTGPSFAAPLAFWIAAWGFGSPLQRRLLPHWTDRPARFLVSAALGWAGLQVVVELLGLTGIFGPGPASVLLVVGLLLAARSVWGSNRVEFPTSSASEGFAWAVFALLLAPALLAVGSPPLGPDEMLYHLRFVDHLVASGGFITHPGDVEAGFAQGMHSMLALPVSLGGVEAARPFALLFALTALVAGQRVTLIAFGRIAATLYLPLVAGAASVLRLAPLVSTDWPVGLFLGVAVLILLDQLRAPNRGGIWALGLLGGAALSVKYTAPLFLAPVYLVLGLALLQGAEEGRLKAIGRLLVAAVIPILFALPWLGRNAVLYGHPLHPIVGLAMPDGDPAAWVFNFTANYGPGEGVTAWLRGPWEFFTMGRELDRRLFLGRLNAWPLLSVPLTVALLLRSKPARALGVVTALGLLAWFGPLRRVAYLLPLWPILAALTAGGLAYGIDQLPRRRPVLGFALLALAIGGLVETAAPRVDLADEAGAATGVESWEQFRGRKLDAERTHAWVRRNVPADDCVALFFVPKVYGIPNRTVFAGAEEMTPLRIALARAGDAEVFTKQLKAWGCPWIVKRTVSWPRELYPMLTEGQHHAGFTEPTRIAEEVIARYTILRFNDGPYAVYELVETDR